VTTELRTTLRRRLIEALRDRDRTLASALRSTLAALDNAEAVAAPATAGEVSRHVAGAAAGIGAAEASRRALPPGQEQALVAVEVADLRAGAAHLAAAGRQDDHAAALAGLPDPA
jgi:hypothetical protein